MGILKDFGMYKAVTAKDPIDMAIGLAMMEEGEEQEREEEEEILNEELQQIIKQEKEEEITADTILEKIERTKRENQKRKRKY